jgi:HAE1 family hydrophobic/amphiphilic exporter-1
MAERQQALLDAIMRDPAVETVGAAVGAGGGVYTLNDGRVYVQLKPNDQRDPIGKVIARLRTNLARIQGITLYMQAAQDITIGARLNKTQFQYTLKRRQPWRARPVGRLLPREDQVGSRDSCVRI